MDWHACSTQMSNCNGCNGGPCKSNKIRPKFMPRRRRGLWWVFWTHYPLTLLNFFSTLIRLGCSLQLEGKLLVPKRRSLCSGPLSPFLMPSWKLLSTCNWSTSPLPSTFNTIMQAVELLEVTHLSLWFKLHAPVVWILHSSVHEPFKVMPSTKII